MTDFGNSNIPHGYNDEGGRGISDRQKEKIEDNWSKIEAHIEKEEKKNRYPECYNCGKKANTQTARIIKKKLVCEDCMEEFGIKALNN